MGFLKKRNLRFFLQIFLLLFVHQNKGNGEFLVIIVVVSTQPEPVASKVFLIPTTKIFCVLVSNFRWSNLCTLVKCGTFSPVTSNESMSDLRFSLQRGLEVVRGEGLSPYLIVALARTFAARVCHF